MLVGLVRLYNPSLGLMVNIMMVGLVFLSYLSLDVVANISWLIWWCYLISLWTSCWTLWWLICWGYLIPLWTSCWTLWWLICWGYLISLWTSWWLMLVDLVWLSNLSLDLMVTYVGWFGLAIQSLSGPHGDLWWMFLSTIRILRSAYLTSCSVSFVISEGMANIWGWDVAGYVFTLQRSFMS